MVKMIATHAFLCLLITVTTPTLCSSDIQKFIDLAQSYSAQLKIDKAYKNQDQITQLAHLLPNAERDLTKETIEQKAHIKEQEQSINKMPGTHKYLESTLQMATQALTAAQAAQPEDTIKTARLAAAKAKAEENLANRNVYDARITMEKAFCNARDFSPLKTAIAQAKAILNPTDEALQKAASQAEQESKSAASELKTAEEALDAQWTILKQKTTETQSLSTNSTATK